MKLYTEEQVREILKSTHIHTDNDVNMILSQFTPIELPSDEEIGRKSVEYSTDTETKEFYKDCCWDFQNGAKWMRDKILNK